MAKVYLSVVGSENGKTIDIPTGKTILGRGPLLGCADKKVSRNHAVLEVLLNGEIYLTPTHVNPCFYRTKSETSLRVIKKDSAQKVEPGDVFSLLPNSFQYQVCLQSNDEKKGSSKPECEDSSVNPPKETTNNSLESLSLAKTQLANECTVVEDATSKSSPVTILEKKSLDNKDSKNEKGATTTTVGDVTPIKTVPTKTSPVKTPSKSSPTKTLKKTLEEGFKTSLQKSTPNDKSLKEKKDILIEDDEEEEEDDEEDEEDEQGDEDEDEEEDEAESASHSKKMGQSKTTLKPSQRPRKRTLPSWLIKSASVPRLKEETNGPSRKTPAKQTPGDKIRQKNSRSAAAAEGNRSSSRSARQNRQTIQRISLDDFVVSEEDWSSDEDEEEKRKTKRGRGTQQGRGNDDDSGSDWEFENRKQQTRWKDGSSDSDWEVSGAKKRRRSKRFRESESGSDWETETRRKKPAVKKSTRGRRSKRTEKEEEDEEEDDESAREDSQSRPPSQGSSRKREPCLFGKKCYRKNTSHFDVYSHPGDSDYTSPDEDRDNSDSKPECRKNPQHRTDNRHTKKIRPKREASQKAGKKGAQDDDEQPEDLSVEESDDYNPESDAS